MEYEITIALRLLLAAVLGALIGLERESLNKAAGFRTNTLVCLGSCLIMVISIEMFSIHGAGQYGDAGRIAAQVVSGIGFLGAGTIMRSGFGVKGLTTAATLWVVAAIGLAVGAGNYVAAVITTLVVFLVLVYMSWLEGLLQRRKKNLLKIETIIEDRPGQLGRVSTVLGEMDIQIRGVEMSEAKADNRVKIVFSVNKPYNVRSECIAETLNRVDGVYETRVG